MGWAATIGALPGRAPVVSIMIYRDPASLAVANALAADPFYAAITAPHRGDPSHQRLVLADYFACSIEEGRRLGRVVDLAEPARGVAVWLLPQRADARAADEKGTALRAVLGEAGIAIYGRIVAFMSRQTEGVVPAGAWYLSILAVDPSAQGRGLGRRLLEPTLAEADTAGVRCYLETFTPRTVRFYERLGFVTRATVHEPTTGAQYAILVREARRRAPQPETLDG